jgi:putative heme iron utilization protein
MAPDAVPINTVKEIRQHASTAPATPSLPEPTHAERVRTLVAQSPAGTLSTISSKHAGYPFGSLMPFALDRKGRPLLLVSSMAVHTHNLKAEPRASLFVDQVGVDGDPLGAARATLIGTVLPVPNEDIAPVREQYLERHENSRYWVDFADFSFYRMEVIDVYYVGGFGVMGWVAADEYQAAAPDPLADSAMTILAHMNADHMDSMLQLARVYAGINGTAATMTSVDRLGFTLRLKTKDGMKSTRINFLREVASSDETRKALVEMVRLVKIKIAL